MLSGSHTGNPQMITPGQLGRSDRSYCERLGLSMRDCVSVFIRNKYRPREQFEFSYGDGNLICFLRRENAGK